MVIPVAERSPDHPDPQDDRLDAAAPEAVRGEWLDGLLEGDDHVRQLRGRSLKEIWRRRWHIIEKRTHHRRQYR
jgi:hypothetical protein